MHLRGLITSSVLAFALALPAAAVAADTAGVERADTAVAGSITVGEFLVEMARVLDPTLPADLPVESAVARLNEAGLTLTEDADLKSTLTEGDVVRFASAVGVRLKTMNPNEVFPADKVGALGDVLRPGLTNTSAASAVLASSANNPNCNPDLGNCGDGSARAREKRKKKKSFESPTGGGL